MSVKEIQKCTRERSHEDDHERYEGSSYEKYGMWLHGVSDELIDGVFEGDPDMYWNID